MKTNTVLLIILIILVTAFGTALVLKNSEDTSSNITTKIVRVFDNDYEPKTIRNKRFSVELAHKRTIRSMWNQDFNYLQKNIAKQFVILEEGKIIDYVTLLKKEAPDATILNEDVEKLFDFDKIQTYSYEQMKKEGMLKIYGAYVQPDDYLAVLSPQNDARGVESMVMLYRLMDGHWIAIGGHR